MKKSKYTKRVELLLWTYRLLDWICLFSPILVYVVIAYAQSGIRAENKLVLTGTLVIAIILTLFNTIAQKKLRCPIWLVLIGIYVCIKEWLLPLIIILAITSVLDDFVFTPLIAKYSKRYEANVVIDERGDLEKKEEA